MNHCDDWEDDEAGLFFLNYISHRHVFFFSSSCVTLLFHVFPFSCPSSPPSFLLFFSISCVYLSWFVFFVPKNRRTRRFMTIPLFPLSLSLSRDLLSLPTGRRFSCYATGKEKDVNGMCVCGDDYDDDGVFVSGEMTRRGEWSGREKESRHGAGRKNLQKWAEEVDAEHQERIIIIFLSSSSSPSAPFAAHD